MRVYLFVMLCLVFPFTSYGTITETEPNNTIATAIMINRGTPATAPWSDNGILNLGPYRQDVDFFSIALHQGETITVSTTPLKELNKKPDTYLALFDSSRNKIIGRDDKSVNDYGSLITQVIGKTGVYYIGITGTGDPNLNGSGNPWEEGNYRLDVSIVPEPGSLVLLGVGVAGLVRRRR